MKILLVIQTDKKTCASTMIKGMSHVSDQYKYHKYMVKCLIIVHRMSIFHKYFLSFEAGNCISRHQGNHGLKRVTNMYMFIYDFKKV